MSLLCVGIYRGVTFSLYTTIVVWLLLRRVARRKLINGDIALYIIILDAGADVNVQGPRLNLTPLHVAVRMARPNQVAVLLKRGADCNAIAETQCSALHEACQNLDVGIIRLLLEHGADPNAKGEVQKFGANFAVGTKTRLHLSDDQGKWPYQEVIVFCNNSL